MRQAPRGLPPIHCSTGGYDRCPKAIACGAPYWTKPFVVTVADTAYTAWDEDTVADYDEDDHTEWADVVMPDGNIAKQSEEVFVRSSKWKARRDSDHGNGSIATLSMEAAFFFPFRSSRHYRELWDFGFGFDTSALSEFTT